MRSDVDLSRGGRGPGGGGPGGGPGDPEEHLDDGGEFYTAIGPDGE